MTTIEKRPQVPAATKQREMSPRTVWWFFALTFAAVAIAVVVLNRKRMLTTEGAATDVLAPAAT